MCLKKSNKKIWTKDALDFAIKEATREKKLNKRQKNVDKQLERITQPKTARGLLGEELFKGAMKGVWNVGRLDASKAIKSDFAKRKIKNVANKYLDQVLDSVTSDLSNKLNPYSGKGLPIPFPFVDWKKAWNVVSAPGLFKGPSVSAKEGREMVAEYKRQYKAYKDAGGSRSYNSWIKWKGYGGGLDIHNTIL